MALKGPDINRACSPMHYVEENLEESNEAILRKKKKLTDVQKIRSPFLIGTIEDVNKRVSRLDRKLQSYTELVVESRASEKSEDYVRPPSSALRAAHSMREKEEKEVNQFAGIYTIKSTLLSKPSERAKNISKISMQNKTTSAKKDKGKPKFVELHQYPGFNSSELTPLPNEVSALTVLTKSADAQNKFDKMPKYRPEFERLFYSQMSQAILQDLFWWVFLDKWQANKHFQHKLFNRIAHNYVKLMTYAKHPQYRESFLKDYPSLLSQAVYAAFCETFPDSYRQFHDDFKEDIVVLTHEWVAGCRPAPRTWLHWNTDALEPTGLKMREEMIKQSKQKDNKKSSVLNFDFIEMGNMTASQSTINQVGSVSSMSSMPGGRRQKGGKKYGSKRAVEKSQNGSSGSYTGSDKDSGRIIKEVAQAQDSDHKRVSTKLKIKALVDTEKDDRLDPLTPIREFAEEDEQEGGSPLGKASLDYVKSYASFSNRKRETRESHPIGKGPSFVKSGFNICGQSPLVAHFLRMKNLDVDAGMHLRVQRTEVTNLPPLNSQTYQDVMKESFKKIRETEKQYSGLCERGQKESTKFIRKLKAEQKDYIKKEVSLLSKPRDVKRLSDLIMLELKKDEDSIGAGADAAIEAALLAQEQ